MKLITYEKLVEFYEKHKVDMDTSVNALEQLVIKGRDEKGIPIYLTKARTKSIESAYLKTKRKTKNEILNITDYCGLRVLCLFEQDLTQVHSFLIDIFSKHSYKLKEFKIFEWNKEFAEELKAITDEKVKDKYDYETEPRESGYKSIHYVVTKVMGDIPLSIEIQLRTLLQDVWGELEHALAYKRGNVNPHISKSFYLLSKDLQNNDLLLANLREISDKEKSLEAITIKDIGPYTIFSYDEEYVPNRFREKDANSKLYQKYIDHLQQWPEDNSETDEWRSKGRALLSSTGEIAAEEVNKGSDDALEYFLRSEEAYWLFEEGQKETALTLYEEITTKWEDRYVPFFRIGEILFILGDIKKCLISFDRCEEIIDANRNGDQNHMKNAYYVKTKIASIYWLLGQQFCDIALNKAEEAENIVEKNPKYFTEKNRKIVTNNLCWYYLEKYVLTRDEKIYGEALVRYRNLEGYLADDGSADLYDTAAWFCYQSYLFCGGEKHWLEKAKEFCLSTVSKEIDATYRLTARNLYRDHALEIMSAK